MSRRPSDEQVVTFLLTDIEGSTKALHRLGARYADALEAHRRLLDHIAGDFGGRKVDAVGDAVLLSFTDPDSAVRTAILAQLAFAALSDWGEDAFRVRMGVHTGPVWTRRKQFFGLTLHKVARISALARGGQILISAHTASLLKSEAMVRRLGTYTLDGFDDPEELYELRVIPLSAAADSLR